MRRFDAFDVGELKAIFDIGTSVGQLHYQTDQRRRGGRSVGGAGVLEPIVAPQHPPPFARGLGA